ncbi:MULTISPECIES: DUF3099 domain-containing protein [unclassified Frigoribacterium]|jgi:hypothetical protein|uniref:DUF3099 domain-containing protein n=1 Tax=unclassified Frigoribacterium TaxID=2627005 RepID=UPI00177C5415|nr:MULTISPECIES: DUF3099 domain-containing protein [unclassified Frigoribacterium]MBD8584381.1 DUF3099 domain-containing protein [Frigoribacterium sp. CFBP 8766]MBD8609139.1 DUF3099 domain-containing protein [Frigoribacterium sp. CFBP 13729]MBF4578221.1 DUF3099 domain-containing protein [Frigoribacterium sp. VKM Ac-2530]
MKTSTPITTLPPSPADDRHARMRRYLLATGIRIVCIIFCFVIPLSWWTLIPVFGAVVIPYVAVVLANVGHESGQDVERPGGLEVYRGPQEPWTPPAPHDPDDDPVVGSDGVPR